MSTPCQRPLVPLKRNVCAPPSKRLECTDFVSLCSHTAEGAAVHDLWPKCSRDINAQEIGNPAHRVIKVSFEVVVVDKQDIRLAAELPPRGNVAQQVAIGASGNPSIKEIVDVAMELYHRVEPLCDGFGIEARNSFGTHIGHVVGKGHEGIATVSADHDVAGSVEDGNAIGGRVGFDKAAMWLRFELCAAVHRSHCG